MKDQGESSTTGMFDRVKSSLKQVFDMSLEDANVEDLFIEELKMMYYVEGALIEQLPVMADDAATEELDAALRKHLEETQSHQARLEEIFDLLGVDAEEKKTEAIRGLLSDAVQMTLCTAEGSMARDVAIIAAAQRIEHLEIASYGTLRALAHALGFEEAEELLGQILKEEEDADKALSQLAVDFINTEAVAEMAEYEEDSEVDEGDDDEEDEDLTEELEETEEDDDIADQPEADADLNGADSGSQEFDRPK